MSNTQILHVNPAEVLADDNARRSLLPSHVSELAASILAEGRVIEPVEMELLPKAVNGCKYRLTIGFGRHAALTELNANGADLTLPAIVRDPGTPLERLKTQVAENVARKSFTPIDMAESIVKAREMGMSTQDIRAMFRRAGGRKGNVVQDASNSWVNMMVSFLEFPKAIQNKIHDGTIGVGAAYKLTTKPRDQWDAIVTAAEQEKAALLEQEEKEEEKFLAAQRKAAEVKEKAEKLSKDLEAASTEAKETKVQVEALGSKVLDLKKQAIAAGPGEEKKKLDAEFKAADDELKDLQKKAKTAAEKAAKLAESHKKVETKVQEAASKADQAKATKKATPKAKDKNLGAGDIEKASAAVSGGRKPLNLNEVKAFIAQGALPGSKPKVTEIFRVIKDCMESVLTDKQAYTAIAVIVGEGEAKKKK